MNVSIRTLAALILVIIVIISVFTIVSEIFINAGQEGSGSAETQNDLWACIQSNPDKSLAWCKKNTAFTGVEDEVAV